MNYNKVKINYNDKYTFLDIKSLNKLYITEKDEQVKHYTFTSNEYENYEHVGVETKETGCKWRQVYKLTLDNCKSFIPGDSVAIVSPNESNLVAELMKYLNVQDKTCYIIREGVNEFTYHGSIRDFFTYVFDLNCLPKKAFLYDIRNDTNKKQIEYLCSREGSRDYTQLASNWNNVLDILKSFDLRPSIYDLIRNCQVIKPRYFSLCNKSGEPLQCYIGITERTIDNCIRYGHCSSTIVLNELSTVLMKIQTSKLIRLGDSKKILCICTGTGICPFLSFIKNKNPDQFIKVIYGFRNVEDDLTMYEDISGYTNYEITRVLSSNKTYVTDYVLKHISMIGDYCDKDCLIYVCGRPAMEKQIFEIFANNFTNVIEEKRIFFDDWN